jgi:predicted HAD superfamily Cof-like phosphohydrolase
MISNFQKVGEFRKAMGLPISNTPQLLTPAETSYFARFIMEELSEYLKANEEGSLVDAADAIVDLVYVTLGCAHAMGLPFDKLFAVVHRANMAKQPANEYVRSVRGFQYDVVKPPGWQAPEAELLRILQSSVIVKECKYCEAFFTRYRCNAPDECDCPKCQGFCACHKQRIDA